MVTASLLGSARAEAAPQPPVVPSRAAQTAPLRDDAEALLVQGKAAFQAGMLEEAEAILELAFALKPSHDIAAILGLVELKLAKAREAAEHLAFALRQAPPSDSDSGRARIRQLLDEALPFVGVLRVKASAEGAEILVDGKVVGKEPLAGDVFVEPGSHRIEARLTSYMPTAQAVTVAKGQSADVALALMKRPMLAEDSRKPAKPGVDEPVQSGGPDRGVLIAGIATSAVTLSGAIAFAIVSSVKAGDADDQREALLKKGGVRVCQMPTALATECDEAVSSLKMQDTFGNLSFWSFIVGGTVGAATGTYALATPKAKPTSTVLALPVAIDHGGGLVVTGRW